MSFKIFKLRVNFPKRVIIIGSVSFISLVIFALTYPIKTRSALSSATATLANPRLSYKAGIAIGTSASTLIQIDGSGNPDNDTNALMPKDTTCFTPSVLVGCRDNTAYEVVGVGTSLTYNVDPALTTSLTSSDYAISTQSGVLTLDFTLGSAIPADGDIYISIPMADNQDGDDGWPDASGTDTSTGGFDLGASGGNKITTSDITVTETCSGTFSVAAVTAGSGTTDHTIEINNSTAACESSSTITIGIGTTANGHLLVNPAPVTTGRTRGQGETYRLNIKTRDASLNTLDNSYVIVAPIEAVLVSATVQETLSFQVCGVKTDLTTQETACFTQPSTVCNQASLNAASYAYSVPFGTLSIPDTQFYNLAQYLKVSTNAVSGYSVKIQQNDQMGKDGGTCSGDPTDPVTSGCIPDNKGDGTLNYNNSDDCDTSANNGLCFSLDDGPETGSPTFAVKWNVATNDCDGSPTFCARTAADQEPVPAETPTTIISKSTAVSANDAFVCWRVSIDGLQPAGYYYNKVKYTAVPVF